jgi:hypothetical protein
MVDDEVAPAMWAVKLTWLTPGFKLEVLDAGRLGPVPPVEAKPVGHLGLRTRKLR